MTDTESVILDVIDAYPGGVDHGSLVRRVRSQSKRDINAINIAIERLIVDDKLQKSDGKYQRARIAEKKVEPKQESLQSQIHQLLQEGNKSVADLADRLGTSLNTIIYHLKSMLDTGDVVDTGLTDGSKRGRPAVLYGLRPARYAPRPATQPAEPPPLRMKHLEKSKAQPCKPAAVEPPPAPVEVEEPAEEQEQSVDDETGPVPPLDAAPSESAGTKIPHHAEQALRHYEEFMTLADVAKKHARPPLDIMPLRTYEEAANEGRIRDLLRALRAHAEGRLPVNPEWVAELQERVTRVPRLEIGL